MKRLQLAKIVLLPPNYEIIMVSSKQSNIAIDIFFIASLKLSLLILFASFLVSVLCFFCDGFLSKVIALPTIAIAIVLFSLALKGDSEKITVTFR